MKARLLFLAASLLIATLPAIARENADYWYIKDFKSEIAVDKDSSLTITEDITADCGSAAGKHGIFRILPTETRTEAGTFKSPVWLVSITDFEGRPYEYSESKNPFDHTITWKIGSADTEVRGENHYRIKYRVKNAIRFGNPEFDELYWNLSGNFWDLEIDNFRARLIFPADVKQEASQIEYYTGALGSQSREGASYLWIAPNILEFNSKGTIKAGDGITASITFPKGLFIPYQPGFFETYGNFFILVLPVFVFTFCLYLWNKYGRDPRINKTVIAEFESPDRLSPIEIGMVETNGDARDSFITAEIINLAVQGLVSIKEIEEQGIIFKSKDYEFSRLENSETEKFLNAAQQAVLKAVFKEGPVVKLTSLKKEFYKSAEDIKSKAKNGLIDKGYLTKTGLTLRVFMLVIGGLFFFATFPTGGATGNIVLAAAFVISTLIIIVFALVMPKRTSRGAEANWKIKGFKQYMETAEKYRQQFYEKEHIFEKLLPYAIVFGMTKEWIAKMKDVYGEQFYANYAPVWFAGNISAFDADSLSAAISNLSSSIASNTAASSSGAGGAGGAGGGGGGGGGGGW